MSDIKILLVEDDAIEAMDIKRILETFGFKVPYIASFGEEAVDKALEILPDLILMDISLKGEIDGIQVASNIKDIGIPVIYLTAHSDEFTVHRAKVTEPYGYIIKPFDPLELKYAIEIALYKKSEEKLRDNEEKLRIKAENELKMANLYNRSLIEASLDPLVTIGPDGKITDVNKATEKVTGFLRDEIIGTDFSVYFTEPEKAREGYQRVFTEGHVSDYPLEIQNKVGKITPVLYNASVYRDASGDVVGVFAAARDITKQKETQKRLKDSEERMRLTLEATQIALWDWDVKNDQWYVSPIYYSMLGYDPLNGPGDREEWLERVHPDDRARVNKKIQNVLVQNFNSYEYEARMLHADGTYRWVNVVGFSIERDPHGKATRILGIRTDITKRKHSEKALRASEKKYRDLFEESFDGLFITSPEGKILDMNKKGIKMFGYDTKEEIMSLDLASDIYADPSDRKSILSMINEQGSAEYEVVVKKKNGDKMITQCSLTAVKDETGQINSYRGIIRDITERKKADEALRLSNNYNRSLIEASLDPLITIGPDGGVNDVNMATEKVTGYSRVELIGSDFSVYFTEPEKAREVYQLVFKDGFVRDYPLKIQHKNGDVTSVLYNASVYRDESGDVVGVFAAARDVTKLNKAKNDLKKTIKEKNVLLSEVHHRVKNNMQIISSLLNLQTHYVSDDKTISILKESQDRVKAMAILYEKLYLSDDLTEINFEEYIQGLIKGLFYTHNVEEGQISTTIEIENIFLNIETSIPCGLIISELVSNSLKHAFSNGRKGKISLSLQSVGDKFELIVSDNGIGFPEDLDFRNTDSLGLQLVNNLVNQIDGEISLEKSHGTQFKILFHELKYKKRI